MASIRPLEERDSKGTTIRVNPSIVFKQDRNIRVVVGRNDFRLDPNPDYHPPITVQVQDGKIKFFNGTPESNDSRRAAKELRVDEVPEYIIAELKARPIKVREARPTVYEVKFVSPDSPEPVVEELAADADGTVTVTPKAPDLDIKKRIAASQQVQA
jgi:hypothetical protein